MRTAAQIAASRRNALRSTGPRSPQGKAVCARNAVKHGLRSQTPPAPDPVMLAMLESEFRPASPMASAAVYLLTAAWTRMEIIRKDMREVHRAERASEIDIVEVIRRRATLIRYDNDAAAAFYRTLDFLLRTEESITSPALFVENRNRRSSAA